MGMFEVGPGFGFSRCARLRHRLAGHPLLQLDALTRLALRHPPEEVRYSSGRVTFATSMESPPGTGLSLAETVRDLSTSGSFVQINRVDSDPDYRPLVDAVLDEMSAYLAPRDGRIAARFCAVFLSSPGAVTPFHLDHEQNFLTQLRGQKLVRVWDARDRSVVPEEALEVFHDQYSLSGVHYREELLPKAQPFAIGPGDAIYMPMGSGHAVENGPEVSVTVSFTFNTEAAQREALAFSFNRKLRKMGFSPAPVGVSPARDRMKARALSLWRSLRRPPPRSRSY